MIHDSAQVTNPKSKATERRQARRDEIVDAAAAIVLADGLEALTAQRLAEQTGAAVGAMYRYFGGVSEIVVALQSRALAELADDLDVAAAAAERRHRRKPRPARALAKVVAACRAFGALHRTAPARHRLIDGLLSAPRPVLGDAELAVADNALAPLIGRVSGWLDDAAVHGGLTPGDAGVRTHILWASMHGIDHLRHRDRAAPPALRTDALRDALLRDLLTGWGARPDDVELALG